MTLPTNGAGVTPPSAVPEQVQTPEASQNAQAGASSQPDWKALAEEWKSRAIGFQKAMQNEQAARQSLEQQAQLASQQITGLTTEREKAVTDLTQFKEQAETKSTELEIANSMLERVTLVATEFPQLLPLLKEDALPDGTGDELRKKLVALAALTGGAQTQAKQEKDRGATPPAPSSAVRDAKTVYAQAMEAAKQNKPAEYDSLMNEYHKLITPAQ
jgi:chromosome segregation ATPase